MSEGEVQEEIQKLEDISKSEVDKVAEVVKVESNTKKDDLLIA